MTTYDIEKCIAVARIVMGRRKKSFTSTEEQVMRTVFAMTAHERS